MFAAGSGLKLLWGVLAWLPLMGHSVYLECNLACGSLSRPVIASSSDPLGLGFLSAQTLWECWGSPLSTLVKFLFLPDPALSVGPTVLEGPPDFL